MDMHGMHATFRTLGQQAGMQLVRAILPESIDVFINETINEKVRSDVANKTVTQYNDRVAIQDNSISPINSIRTLYKKSSLSIVDINADDDFYVVPMDIQKVMYYTSFGVKYDTVKRRFSSRFIEGDKLNDTRQDYLNKESWQYPIVTMYSDQDDKEYIELYIDNTTLIPDKLEVSYIELPAVVKWDSLLVNCVNCNLPEYIHNEIVELAVAKFFNSVGYTSKQVTRN